MHTHVLRIPVPSIDLLGGLLNRVLYEDVYIDASANCLHADASIGWV